MLEVRVPAPYSPSARLTGRGRSIPPSRSLAGTRGSPVGWGPILIGAGVRFPMPWCVRSKSACPTGSRRARPAGRARRSPAVARDGRGRSRDSVAAPLSRQIQPPHCGGWVPRGEVRAQTLEELGGGPLEKSTRERLLPRRRFVEQSLVDPDSAPTCLGPPSGRGADAACV